VDCDGLSIYVCSLAQDRGSCKNYTIMWFFDNSLGRCSRFWYGGCGGNENRFWTQKECENRCPTKTPGRRGDKKEDVCMGYVQKWYYDKHIGACSPFWYGGCAGNANRFDTEHECFRTCGNKKQNECSRFWYGGCGGNGNRFKTQQEYNGWTENTKHLQIRRRRSQTSDKKIRVLPFKVLVLVAVGYDNVFTTSMLRSKDDETA
uniref:BPTI/Kunitz inhibitor domain-containing protein n=1 Tax=Lates calcarifer TaxID=8187 RepID=A0A4W6DNM3_LATCA